MKQLVLALALFSASINTSAVTFNETTNARLDTEFLISGEITHVDTTTNLEWLDFGSHDGSHVTFGQSVKNAQVNYGSQGFRLATETEVRNLFTFFFTDFVDSGNGTMTVYEDPSLRSVTERNSWLLAFGTDTVTTGTTNNNETLFSAGMYKDDDGTIQLAGFNLTLEPTTARTKFYSTEFNVAGGLGSNAGYDNLGVFMVRDYAVVPISPAVWLFGSGLLGLVAIARRHEA